MNSRVRVLISVALLLALAMPAVAQPLVALPKGAIAGSIDNWSRVKVGMSAQKVISLLGKPFKVYTIRGVEEWQYQFPQGADVLRVKGGKVIKVGGGAG